MTTWSLIAFANRVTALAAEARWRRFNLEVCATDAPTWMPAGHQYQRCFRTSERAYDFRVVFDQLKEKLAPERIVQAEVMRLLRHGDYVTGAVLRTSAGEVTARARRLVLAAGVENEHLVGTVTTHRGRAVSRTSYMLVLRSKYLPRASLICPENDSYGCFLVSRWSEDRIVWLVSNFISFARLQPGEDAQRYWTVAALRTLARVYAWRDDPSLECGVYEAPKMELRAQPGVIAPHAIERYGMANLAVAAPTKITLAPLLAGDIVERVKGWASFNDGRAIAAGPEALPTTMPTIRERWRADQLRPQDRFLDEERLQPTARSL